MEKDMAGYSERKVGDKLIVNRLKAVVESTERPLVLCPCPDNLTVRYFDTGATEEVENSDYQTWE